MRKNISLRDVKMATHVIDHERIVLLQKKFYAKCNWLFPGCWYKMGMVTFLCIRAKRPLHDSYELESLPWHPARPRWFTPWLERHLLNNHLNKGFPCSPIVSSSHFCVESTCFSKKTLRKLNVPEPEMRRENHFATKASLFNVDREHRTDWVFLVSSQLSKILRVSNFMMTHLVKYNKFGLKIDPLLAAFTADMLISSDFWVKYKMQLLKIYNGGATFNIKLDWQLTTGHHSTNQQEL